MVLASILSIVVAIFITRPITAYTSVTRRAELADAADLSLRQMTRDIQQAVPNSLRVKVDPNNANRIAIEMINVVEGMRYRGAGVGPYLSFTQSNTQFDVIGQFQFATTNTTCMANACRLVVYNTGANTGGTIPSDNPSPGANVYSTVPAPSCTNCLPPPGSVTITPPTTTVTLTNGTSEGSITLNTATTFALPSPRQRIEIIDTPISYVCDTTAGVQSITRFWNYTINQVQPTNPTVAPFSTASSAQLAQDVATCDFVYTPGTAQQNGIISMQIALSKGGETITLMRQVQVDNSP